MLPDDQLHLLTAAVDGESTPAEELSLRRLLASSGEARYLFAHLQSDQNRLRNRATAQPPTDLRERIMARLPFVLPLTTSKAAPVLVVPTRRARPWVPLALAASLLIGVTAASFLFFTQQENQKHPTFARHGNTQPLSPNHPSPIEPNWAAVLPKENAPLPSVPHVAEPLEPAGDHLAHVPSTPSVPDVPEVIPPPRLVVRDVNAFPPLLPIPPLERVQVRVPFLTAVCDLDRDDVRQRLTEELGRDPAFRIDLFTKDAARGVELFHAAAKQHGLHVLTDAVAHDRVKRKAATAYLVYAECLTPAELRDLLTKLSAADAKNAIPVFDTLHITPASAADAKEVKDVLGTDLGWAKRPHPHKGAAHLAEPKPISSGTGDQIAKSLTGSTAKPPGKPAVLMTFGPAHARTPPMMSKELRQYFEQRGDRKPTTIPVAIVIRQANTN